MHSTLTFKLHSIENLEDRPQKSRVCADIWDWKYSRGGDDPNVNSRLGRMDFSLLGLPALIICLLAGLLSYVSPRILCLLKLFYNNRYCDVRTCACWVLTWARIDNPYILVDMRQRLQDPIADVRRNALKALVWNNELVSKSRLPNLEASLLFEALELDSVSDLSDEIHHYFARLSNQQILSSLAELFELEGKRSNREFPFQLETLFRRLERNIPAQELATALLQVLSKEEELKSQFSLGSILARKRSALSRLAQVSLKLEKNSELRLQICNELYLQTLDGRYSELREEFAFLADLLEAQENDS